MKTKLTYEFGLIVATKKERDYWKDKIKNKIEELDKNELLGKYNYEQVKIAIDILNELLKGSETMEEIKVGEYVRSKSGVIGKVIGIHTIEKYKYHYISTFVCYETEDITKHSPNIIDLIEVGDIVETFYVSVCDVVHIWNEEMLKALREDIENGIGIKSIVTKEQFNSIKYVIGE